MKVHESYLRLKKKLKEQNPDVQKVTMLKMYQVLLQKWDRAPEMFETTKRFIEEYLNSVDASLSVYVNARALTQPQFAWNITNLPIGINSYDVCRSLMVITQGCLKIEEWNIQREFFFGRRGIYSQCGDGVIKKRRK